ncbi:MAG: hypothetical protein K0S23_3201 [Fluviicola sp.]|jgi:hypothetical protein|uniref:hypothetical protein n=1 Tax=Fluviicola sp. TaxID=1917219 RepID=UPI00260441D2|nr:hypothetical protein [Fluviicola sp.]MDF3028894.1 hypothetical protein [Fluviicola sp.]
MEIFLNKDKWKSKLDLLVENRTPMSKEEIGVIASEEDLDYEITLKVLDFLKSYLPVNSNFPFKLDDDLLNDYNVDSEDLGDFYTKILKKMSVPVPGRIQQDLFFENKREYTLRLAIEFIQWCCEKRDEEFNL